MLSVVKEIAVIDKIYAAKNNTVFNNSSIWKIPLCYDSGFRLDLNTISVEKNIAKSEIISRHS